jgi:voltage-gated potassium channel
LLKKRITRKKARASHMRRFVRDISVHTPFSKMILLLVVLWILFSTALYLSERDLEASSIDSYDKALYWGIAAFSTAGIADTPVSATARVLGGMWIVIGSVLFFGTIVATVTTYFMRPLQRPHKQIIDTIEYDTLIVHVENLKQEQS